MYIRENGVIRYVPNAAAKAAEGAKAEAENKPAKKSNKKK